MVRKELHAVARPFFDCTSYRRPLHDVTGHVVDSDLHLHAELTRPLPKPAAGYGSVKVALKLAA